MLKTTPRFAFALRLTALTGALLSTHLVADDSSPLLHPTRPEDGEYVGGVPLGGVGAGSVELRGDGSFRAWQIFNNWGNTPKVVLFKHFPSFDLLNAFAAVKVDDQAYVLETHPAEGLPGVAAIKYDGWFPFANLEYGLAENAPVIISLEAFGSYIPHDSKDSGIPAIGLTYHFKNTSSQARKISLALSLVNPLGSVCKEETAGTLHVAESIDNQAGVGLAALDGNATSLLGGTDTADTLKAFWNDFKSPTPQFASTGQGQRIAQVVTFDLQPGEEKSERFVIGWYFPDHHENEVGPLVGHQYEAWTDSTASSVNLLASRFDELSKRSAAWKDTMRDASWPDWVTRWLCNSQSTVVKTSWWVKDGRFMTFESVQCPNSSPVHIIDLADWPILDAFPEIELGLLSHFAQLQAPDGKIPEEFAKSTTPTVTLPDFSRDLYDVNPKYVVEIFQRWRETGDRDFLDATWPSVKKAIAFNNTKYDYLHIGIPSGKGIISTWDHWSNEYAFSFGGTVWLESLKAAIVLAKVENDPEFAAQAQAMYDKALASMSYFWNGQFYAMAIDEKLQQDNLSFLDSTYGDVEARFVGLGPILPDDKSLATLRAVAKYNQPPTPYGIVISADTSGKMVEYGHDVRAQITTCHSIPAPIALIQQGNAADQETGMDILRKIYAIAEKHPGGLWNMPHHAVAATGERNVDDFPQYLRDRCIWALLKVLNGWSYDAADQSLDIGPVLNPEKCHGPWICSKAYGTLAQAIDGKSQNVSLKTSEGALSLKQIAIRSHVGKATTATASLDGKALPASLTQEGDQVQVRFPEAATLNAGSDLEINLTGIAQGN